MVRSTQREEFMGLVDHNLTAVTNALSAYRRQHRLLSIGGIIAGGVATALTGGVAAGGLDVANAMGGWRLVCVLAAVAAAAATVLAGVQERLRTPDHVANASACAAKLNALRFSLRTGGETIEEYRNEYKELIEKYNEYLVRS